jgi:hypothetical protein
MKVLIGISASLLFLAFYSTTLFSQTVADRSQIWQECMNIFELQDHILGDLAGSDLPVYVVDGAVAFPGGTGLTSFGRRVEALAADPVDEAGIAVYFRFDKLEVLGNSATVDFSLSFRDDLSEGSFRTLHVLAEMQKTPNGWSVKEKTLEEE